MNDVNRTMDGSSLTKAEPDRIQADPDRMLGGSSSTKAEADWIQGEPDRIQAESSLVVVAASFTGQMSQSFIRSGR